MRARGQSGKVVRASGRSATAGCNTSTYMARAHLLPQEEDEKESGDDAYVCDNHHVDDVAQYVEAANEDKCFRKAEKADNRTIRRMRRAKLAMSTKSRALSQLCSIGVRLADCFRKKEAHQCARHSSEMTWASPLWPGTRERCEPSMPE